MAKILYDTIEPNVADVDVQGAQVEVTWKCPVSGKVVGKSVATMQSGGTAATEVKNRVASSAVMSVVASLMPQAMRMFGPVGGQVAATAIRETGNVIRNEATKKRYSVQSEHEAIVAAFETVKDDLFVWNEDRELYVAK